MEEHKISIVLPVYNGQKYLSKSIESCLNQTYQNIELIIVNDCSTDNSKQIIEKFAINDIRVKVINNESNRKLPASLNIGHKASTGNFITWTSDDNIYNLDALQKLSSELINKNLDIVYSDFILIDAYDNDIREVKLLDIENVIFGNHIGASFLYKREVYERNICYDENLFLVEDYDFWLRSISHSKFGKINASLYRYRKHSQTLTNQIAIDNLKNELWKANVFKMYYNFCTTILGKEDSELAGFLSKKLSHERLDFEWLRSNRHRIKFFKKQLLKSLHDKNAIEVLFMRKHIEILTADKNMKNYLNSSFYIVKKYFKVIDNNSLKTLVKFSFFK